MTTNFQETVERLWKLLDTYDDDLRQMEKWVRARQAASRALRKLLRTLVESDTTELQEKANRDLVRVLEMFHALPKQGPAAADDDDEPTPGLDT